MASNPHDSDLTGLTGAEAKVLTFIQAQDHPVDLEAICAETLLPPDIAVKAIAVLLEARRIEIHKTEDERVLELASV